MMCCLGYWGERHGINESEWWQIAEITRLSAVHPVFQGSSKDSTMYPLCSRTQLTEWPVTRQGWRICWSSTPRCWSSWRIEVSWDGRLSSWNPFGLSVGSEARSGEIQDLLWSSGNRICWGLDWSSEFLGVSVGVQEAILSPRPAPMNPHTVSTQMLAVSQLCHRTLVPENTLFQWRSWFWQVKQAFVCFSLLKWDSFWQKQPHPGPQPPGQSPCTPWRCCSNFYCKHLEFHSLEKIRAFMVKYFFHKDMVFKL